MSQQTADALRLARLATTGRLALACALELHRLLGLAAGRAAAAPESDLAHELRDTLGSAGDLTRRLVTTAQRPTTTEVIDLGDLVEELTGRTARSTLPGSPRSHALLSVVDDQRSHVATITQACTRCGAVPALGLPLVRAIAASHRGGLVVGPSRDGGVEYRVRLPLAPS